MKTQTVKQLQSIAVDEVSVNGKGAAKLALTKGKYPLGTAITDEDMQRLARQGKLSDALKWYLTKIDLNISSLNVTYVTTENGETGTYKAYGSSAFWLHLLGYPATVEDQILTVSIELKDTTEIKEPNPRLGTGWVSLVTPSGHLVPVRYI